MRMMKTLSDPNAHNFPAFSHMDIISAHITPGENPPQMENVIYKENGRTRLTLLHNRDTLLLNIRDFTSSGA